MLSKHLRIKIILILVLVSVFMVSGMWLFHNLLIMRDWRKIFDGLFVFIIIVSTLIILAAIIICFLLAPVSKILRRIEQGEEPEINERLNARNRIKLLPVVFILVNVCGFFIGPIAMMIVRIFTQHNSFFNLINMFTIFYNVTIGLVSSLEMIALSDNVLAGPKTILDIHRFHEGKTKTTKDLSQKVKNILVPVALAAMVSSMIGFAGLAYYQKTISFETQMKIRILTLTEAEYASIFNEKIGTYFFQLVFLFTYLLIIVFIISLTFSSGLVNQINRMSTKIKKLLSGEDPLAHRLPITHFDEFGELTDKINTFIDFLMSTFKNIKLVSDDVSASTVSLHASVEQVTASTFDSKNAADKVAQTLENQINEVYLTQKDIGEIMNSIHVVSQNVEKQAVFIEQSSAAITEMITGINSLRTMVNQATAVSGDLEEKANTGDQKVNDTIESMKQIEKSSRTVEEIVGMISNIASQTNLLAMNAAIEAAHAGEVGKGFAVVSDEIRKLAEESDKSAKHISVQMKTMNNDINTGVALTRDTGETLKYIITDIRQNTVLMQEICNAIQEQSAGTEQILTSTQSVINATNEIKNLTRTQWEKNQYIKNRLELLNKETGKIEDAVKIQKECNNVLILNLEKIKEVADSNNIVVTRLQNSIGSGKV